MNSFAAVIVGACIVFGEVLPNEPQIDADATVSEVRPAISLSVDAANETLPPVFDRIIFCESSGDPQAQNPVSTASGLYQFINGTWLWVWQDLKGVEPPTDEAWQAPVELQTVAAKKLYSIMGLTPWAASQHCWGG
jgi:hypothetical protein